MLAGHGASRAGNASHRQQGRHQLDPIPQVLYPEILAVLIVVMIADWNHMTSHGNEGADPG
jgi:hypothetical protein